MARQFTIQAVRAATVARLADTPVDGEIVIDTDMRAAGRPSAYVGDGATAGGKSLVPSPFVFDRTAIGSVATPPAPTAAIFPHNTSNRIYAKFDDGTFELIGPVVNKAAAELAPVLPGSGEVSTNIGVHGSFDTLEIHNVGTTQVQVTAQGVYLRSRIQYDGLFFARPFTLSAPVSVTIPTATDTWIALHMHGDTVGGTIGIVTSTSYSNPTIPAASNFSAFIGWVRILDNAVVAFQQTGRRVDTAYAAGYQISGTTWPTAMTLVPLTTQLPPIGVARFGGRYRISTSSNVQAYIQLQPSVTDFLGLQSLGMRSVRDPTVPVDSTNGIYLLSRYELPTYAGRQLAYSMTFNPAGATLVNPSYFIDVDQWSYRG